MPHRTLAAPLQEQPEEEKRSNRTLSKLLSIAIDMQEARSNAHDIRFLLRRACDTLKSPHVGPELVAVREAIERYLSGSEKSLDKAFGIQRQKRGNPSGLKRGKRSHPQLEIATTLLRHLLSGARWENAIYDTKTEFKCGRTTVTDAWKSHKFSAFKEVRARRPVESPWDEYEIEVIEKRFPHKKFLSWLADPRMSKPTVRRTVVRRIPK